MVGKMTCQQALRRLERLGAGEKTRTLDEQSGESCG